MKVRLYSAVAVGVMKARLISAVAVVGMVGVTLGACDPGIIEPPPAPWGSGGSAPPDFVGDERGWQPTSSDAPPSSDPQEPAPEPAPPPDSVTVRVGINRSIVDGYPGDACGSVARFMTIEVAEVGGAALPRQDLDCQLQGYNGWTYYEVPPGRYEATVQLFDLDASGNRVPLTAPRYAEVEHRAGTAAIMNIDYTYEDFTRAYSGSLKWQVSWVSASEPDVLCSCTDASPAVTAQRVVLFDDHGVAVDGWSKGPSGFTPLDGTATGPCSAYATSDAEVVAELEWGVYTVRVEGLDASGQVAYCVEQDLFAPRGDGVIFHLEARSDGC